MSKGRWRDGRRAWERLSVWHDDKVTGPGSRDREPDPLDALGDVGLVRRLLDEAELRAVRSARQRRKSWAEIATRLGVTRQSAWERWRDLDLDGPDGAPDDPTATDPTDPTGRDDALRRSVGEVVGAVTGRARRGARTSTTTVPSVIGKDVEEARRILAEHHLMAVGSDPDAPPLDVYSAPGAVVTAQAPESGAVVARASRVTLWLDPGEGGVREPRTPRPEPLVGRKMLDHPVDDEVEQVG